MSGQSDKTSNSTSFTSLKGCPDVIVTDVRSSALLLLVSQVNKPETNRRFVRICYWSNKKRSCACFARKSGQGGVRRLTNRRFVSQISKGQDVKRLFYANNLKGFTKT